MLEYADCISLRALSINNGLPFLHKIKPVSYSFYASGTSEINSFTNDILAKNELKLKFVGEIAKKYDLSEGHNRRSPYNL